MARGALVCSGCDVAIAITGVTVPAPDEDGNPVGLVHVAVATSFSDLHHQTRQIPGQASTRIREEVLQIALELLLESLVDLPRSASPGHLTVNAWRTIHYGHCSALRAQASGPSFGSAPAAHRAKTMLQCNSIQRPEVCFFKLGCLTSALIENKKSPRNGG
jgi:hypothetical protein